MPHRALHDMERVAVLHQLCAVRVPHLVDRNTLSNHAVWQPLQCHNVPLLVIRFFPLHDGEDLLRHDSADQAASVLRRIAERN